MNNTGAHNTATGVNALGSNTTGFFNTTTRADALLRNNTGFENTANGRDALLSNTVGYDNTASGNGALFTNTAGIDNTANGAYALYSNTTGIFNTGTGSDALYFNTTGNDNTAIGFEALLNNTTGGSNIALGDSAGINLTTGSNNIDVGNKGITGESKTIRIGKKGTHTTTVIAGISGATVPGGVGVIIDTNSHLGTVVSSERFKDEMKPMDNASEAILALKPVTFRYKKEVDPDSIPQFVLVAEDVEKVNPDLVACDAQGKPSSVRYEAVNAMLLNEFLKEHHQVQDLKAIVAEQQKQIQVLTTGLQRLTAQLELSKSASQTVLNH